ncbi:MAG: helicase C-terminal domain-containing protein, partial [Saprospiraceae bacterium]|nr:helicase C-terminal domain-containing protein [Saprospiraceae bacterium]
QDDIITVSFPEGGSTSVEKVTWERIKYEWDEKEKKVVEKVEGTFTQYPLKLAWAITVHKSQGLSLDRVFADVSNAWDSGQVYVALSRCTTFDGLKLAKAIERRAIRVAPEVEEFYEWVLKETELQDKPPDIAFFESDLTLLSGPVSIQLRWSVPDASKVIITGLGEQPSSGSATVTPKRATKYQITAYNQYGISSTKSIQINVSDKPPLILNFTSDRLILTDKTPAVLSWQIEGAENIYIEPGLGKVSGKTSIEVSPKTDQIYTLRAESYFGTSVTKQIEVQVSKEPPVIEFFNTSQEYILAEMPVELSWKITNAERVEISPFTGEIQKVADTITINPKESISFKLTAYSPFGIAASRTLQIFTIPVPIIESILVPNVAFDAKLNIAFDRPVLPDFSKDGNLNEFPWVGLEVEHLTKIDVHIPPRASIWRLPDFDSVFDQIRAQVSHKLQELIDLLKRN